MANHYELLGVAANAPSAEIRQAYARLAREKHPDRFTDPAEKARAQDLFKDITSAFNTLMNEKSRREYDATLAKPRVAVPAEIAQRAYDNGHRHFEAKAYHEAVELFRTAVQHQPQEARYHASLAMALARNPHWVREAMQSLEQAIQLQPKNAEYHAQLAQLYLSQGLKIRARKSAEAALLARPGHELAMQILEQAAPEPPPGEASDGGGGLKGLLKRKP